MDFLSNDWCGFHWGDWIKFEDFEARKKEVSIGAGVYRVKICDRIQLAYIGQTGRSLRERVTALIKGYYSIEMPFNDPHTCAPNLWAWKDSEKMNFEISVACIEVGKAERLSIEAMLLKKYGDETEESTLCNFGHFHPNYIKSKDRSSGFRGYRLFGNVVNSVDRKIHLSISELIWTERFRLDLQNINQIQAKPGLYRIWNGNFENECWYIGQSQNLKDRLSAHLSKFKDHSAHIECVVFEKIQKHHLLQLENDLIAQYYIQTGNGPIYQFGER